MLFERKAGNDRGEAMIRILVICTAVIVFSAPATAEDARYYSLVNRLSKLESEVVDLERLKQRVSQLEVMNTQHKRRLQDQSLRIDQLSEQNKSLLDFVNKICQKGDGLAYQRACEAVDKNSK